MLGLVNSFIHAIMYGYYLLTTVAPEYKKSIWWKKYITRMQLVSFIYFVGTAKFRPNLSALGTFFLKWLLYFSGGAKQMYEFIAPAVGVGCCAEHSGPSALGTAHSCEGREPTTHHPAPPGLVTDLSRGGWPRQAG